MFRFLSQRTTLFITLFALTFGSGQVRADDTEIYFSSGSATGNQSTAILPNVLLILDTSGSMSATVSGTGKSRMELMKEAMRSIITDVQDVKMGLMRFTYTEGGAVVFPIAGIDDPAFTVVSEPDDSVESLAYSIIASSDDAEEDREGTSPGFESVTINDAVLNISEENAAAGSISNAKVEYSDDDADQFGSTVSTTLAFFNDGALEAARFRGLNIPDGATITRAQLTLTERFGIAGGGTATVTGERVANCGDYSSPSTNELSNRLAAAPTPTVKTHNVTGGDNVITDTGGNLTQLIQELVDVDAGVGGNTLCLFYQCQTGCGGTFESADTDLNNSPELLVEYTVAGGINKEQLIGLRFQDVRIPQGASIIDAKLVLVPTSSDPDATKSIVIRAEDVDDSTTFSATNTNISSRPTTAKSTTWTYAATTADNPITSCVNGNCTGNSLAQVIEDVVGRTNWCGGNNLSLIVEQGANGGKDFYSYDGDSGLSPKLQVTYDRTGTLGCVVATDTAQIATGVDDVENSGSGGSQLDFQPGNNIGLRFQNIDVPQGATILDAYITITARRDDTGSTTDINIWGEAADNPSSYGNVNSRSKTTQTVLWEPTNWTQNVTYDTPDISDIVKEIVDRGGWNQGNAMAFIMETSGPNRRGRSYNDSPTRAPRLSITYQSNGGFSPVKTVREKLIELVNDFPTSDWTPITEVMYEAAKYWRGEAMVYGDERDGLRYTRLSHPGTYCEDENVCSTADTAGFPPYAIDNPVGCPADNLDDYDCRNRQIRGTPVYISPFDSELSCASNYQILLTDGQANSANMEATIESEFGSEDFGVDVDGDGDGDGQCRTQNSTGGFISTSQRCAIDLTEYMNKVDQSASLQNDQTVKTYTVGFNFTDQFIEDMATEAGGEFFPATTADDLVSVFETILTDVKSDPTSFVAPSLATNAFNRLLSRDEVYFGLFTPELNAAWDGNVKKYKVCIESDPDGDGVPNCTLGSILDQTGGLAIDEVTNRFKDTAQSYWSSATDGLTTTAGGTGAEFDDFTDRIIYTETTASGVAPASGTLLSGSGYKITSANWDDAALAPVRDAVCPTPSTSGGSQCEDRMLWMLGKVLLEEETDVDADTRWTVNDVLHSSPSIITYGGADTDADNVIDTFYDKLVYGSNEGAIHFVNAADNSGKEEWSFIPQELINNQQAVYTNAEGNHVYGMDITPVINQRDVDGDGIIETGDGDFVHIIAAMRRGGNNIYALDVSADVSSTGQTVTPRFLWRIEGGTGDYARLANTFSRPVLGNIKALAPDDTNVPADADSALDVISKRIMVFGGGYDTALDSSFGTSTANPNNGNMIFIADPADGSLIFSIGGPGTGADIEIANMVHSFPSRVTLLDSDGDGFQDRIYIGDTGGQVWRVDLGADINPSATAPEGSTIVGRLATISTQGTPADERRFFEPPSVVQVLDTLYADAANNEYDYVLIGTGNRSNPLNAVTQDRFYAFRDYTINRMTDSNADNIADDYPRSGGTPINHTTGGDLVDVTSSVLDENSSTVDASFGWFYDFYTANGNTAGEKVLSAPLTLAGTVLFTTYSPDASNNVDACAANIGGGFAYNFDILSTKATLDWNTTGLDEVADRKQALGGGIPSDVVPIFTKEGIVGIVGVEGGATQLGTLAGLPRFRTYWYEEG
ncbi:MAG: PilC/PilY family type IV pilus protein [Gammaproteobacteria bacterium]